MQVNSSNASLQNRYFSGTGSIDLKTKKQDLFFIEHAGDGGYNRNSRYDDRKGEIKWIPYGERRGLS